MVLIGIKKPVKYPFPVIAVDIMGLFPRSPEGFKYLLHVADWFSKHNLLCPMREVNAKSVVKILEHYVLDSEDLWRAYLPTYRFCFYVDFTVSLRRTCPPYCGSKSLPLKGNRQIIVCR